VEIHATRGSTTPEAQYSATKNWLLSPNNISGRQPDGTPIWGSSCSYILGRDGKICKALEDNQMPTFSAGYGSSLSGWSIDEYGVSVEWCQSANQEEYTTIQYERGAVLYAYYSVKYNIDPTIITIPNQTGQVPTGFVRHDGCENGFKLGKTDPGPKFRNNDFVDLVRSKINGGGGDDELNEEQNRKLDEIWNKSKELLNHIGFGVDYNDSLSAWINRVSDKERGLIRTIIQEELDKLDDNQLSLTAADIKAIAKEVRQILKDEPLK
jgi:hypothetical protein